VQFTPTQVAALRQLRDSVTFGDPDESVVDRNVMDVSLLLVQHSDYWKGLSPLIFFSGILGYDTNFNKWNLPSEYTPKLAAMLFCFRVLQLEAALPTDGRDRLVDEGKDPEAMYSSPFESR